MAFEVYEGDADLGLLGPKLVVDNPGTCAAADAISAPILTGLVPPLFVAVRRPTATSSTVQRSYQLQFTSRTGFCSDGIVDLVEECDDANLVSGDGCNASCRVEGLTEQEPNDLSPASIPLDTPVRGFLAYDDVDVFRFTIGPGDVGPRAILLEAPGSGGCDLDASLVLTDSAGTLLATDDNGGMGCPLLAGAAMILTQGVYQLEVRPGRGATRARKGRYVFAVR